MRYLVVAHKTAASAELVETLSRISRDDAEASFTVLVPAVPPEEGLTWNEGKAAAMARRAAQAAQARFQNAGLRVDDAAVGDSSPLQAIADVLTEGQAYGAIVISTLPPGMSRWLKLDVHARARRLFKLPVISVIAQEAAAGAPQAR